MEGNPIAALAYQTSWIHNRPVSLQTLESVIHIEFAYS